MEKNIDSSNRAENAVMKWFKPSHVIVLIFINILKKL